MSEKFKEPIEKDPDDYMYEEPKEPKTKATR